MEFIMSFGKNKFDNNNDDVVNYLISKMDDFSFGENENEASWFISMSDLMSLLLVFFLVWTALNLTEKERVVPEAQVLTEQVAGSEKEGGSGRRVEFIPTNLKDSYVLVSFKENSSRPAQSGAVAQLTPVDLSISSLD